MPSIPIAAHVVTGGILTLVLPVAILAGVLIWWAFLFNRRIGR
jgi:hypothetical protein